MKYLSIICTVDNIHPTLTAAIANNQWIESITNVGDYYYITLGSE